MWQVAEMPCIVRFMPSAGTAGGTRHPRRAGDAAHRVVALALDSVVLLDLAAPTHLFGHCGRPHYTFALAGVHAGPVRSSTGIEVVATSGIEALRRADTIVVPGMEADSDPDGFAV